MSMLPFDINTLNPSQLRFLIATKAGDRAHYTESVRNSQEGADVSALQTEIEKTTSYIDTVYNLLWQRDPSTRYRYMTELEMELMREEGLLKGLEEEEEFFLDGGNYSHVPDEPGDGPDSTIESTQEGILAVKARIAALKKRIGTSAPATALSRPTVPVASFDATQQQYRAARHQW